MVVYWYASHIDKYLLDCQKCSNRYEFASEGDAIDAVELHTMCGKVG